MENKGLLFIPDISGFTQFVNTTEIDHSRLIIQELLEVIINANQIGLEISEIEGDAILFYKFGDSPDLNQLYKQVEHMFCEFHKHLIAYDHRRFCQCVACKSAIDLTLKVITHYGEFTKYNVKNFQKLIGKDIIIAHQLLKNDIDQHEYWLVTKNLLPDSPRSGLEQWMKWNSSIKQTETGEIPFHYTHLTQLKKDLAPEPLQRLNLLEKVKEISLVREYETDIIVLFHAVGDFKYRSKWQEGVKVVEEVSHFLPRIGTRCRCLMESGEVFMYASSILFDPERIEFSETDEKSESSKYYVLEKIGENKIRLTLDYYLKKNIVDQLIFNLFKKKKMSASLHRSMHNLDQLVKEIHLPVPVNSSIG